MDQPPTRELPAPAPAPTSPRVVQRRDWLPSLVWLIPIVAALVGIGLVVRILTQRGPEITLRFQTAEGLAAGKTAVKYKDVQIGTVQGVQLARDRSHVNVVVQLNKEADGFTADDTTYWVVRPRLDTSGISGLGTLLSGAYIGADAGVSEQTTNEFVGLEAPPIVARGESGRQYLLHASDIGSLDVGSPVYFRRIKVGQVAAYDLDPEGRGITLRIFVNAPYDKFVGTNTRFWHASGLDMQVDAGGIKLRAQSLVTILLGGVAFQAPNDNNGPAAKEATTFGLAANEAAAMREPDGPSLPMMMYFNQSLRGLAPGAPVDFRGVVVGEVKSIGIEFDRTGREFRMPVLVQTYPNRLARRSVKVPDGDAPDPMQVLQTLIGKGLRAQLRSGNLLSGQLYVALDFFPGAASVKVDLSKTPLEMATVPNGLDEIQSEVQDIVRKVNKVPFDQIGEDLRKTLATMDKTLTTSEQLVQRLNTDVAPEIAAAVKDARRTLDSADRTLSQDAPLQQDLRQTLQEMTRAATSLRVLTDYLERHPESLLRGKPEDKR